MKWLDTKKSICDCEADITQVSTVQTEVRGELVRHAQGHKLHLAQKRAQRVRHYRARDDAYFWHWSDSKVRKT